MTTQKRATAKPADDEPFDFNLDAVKVEKDLRPFRLHYGGRRWEMKHSELIDALPTFELLEKYGAVIGEAVGTLAMLREALGDQWTEFHKLGLTQPQMGKLSDAYNRHCGTDPGESSGSTDS